MTPTGSGEGTAKIELAAATVPSAVLMPISSRRPWASGCAGRQRSTASAPVVRFQVRIE